ncbi:MAG: 30S ribosomal protein S19e, partial [Nanoarchaeota archaeon]
LGGIKMTSIYKISGIEYNQKLAEALKEIPEIKEPEWVKFVKSGSGKQRPINEPDFWYKRAASILRQIYLNNIVGVNRLKTKYGNKKNRGMKPEKFVKGSGKIIRVILQQADKAGFTEMIKKPKAGRKLTEKGKGFLDGVN